MPGCFCTGACRRYGYCPVVGGPPLDPRVYVRPFPEPVVKREQGWECPKCGAVMAPWMPYCDTCKPKASTTERVDDV